jgi:hypothetical protein
MSHGNHGARALLACYQRDTRNHRNENRQRFFIR